MDEPQVSQAINLFSMAAILLLHRGGSVFDYLDLFRFDNQAAGRKPGRYLLPPAPPARN